MEPPGTRRAFGQDFGWAWIAGLSMAAATVLLAFAYDLPIRDPDSLIPGYIRFPAIVLGAILLDIAPRAIWRARRAPSTFVAVWRDIVHERWPLSHGLFALGGVAAWYLCYATFRNLKSMAPFVNENIYDEGMAKLDKVLFLGNDPADLLHDLLGTTWAAHLFSSVYIIWIVLVPVSIAVALVWTRHPRGGAWYVTAVAFDWLLGAATYLMFPSVGPIYSDPATFEMLPETYVSRLQDSMWADRVAVLADPWGSGTLQTIAAFASLHVGIMVTICLMTHYLGLPRWMRWVSWAFLALTVLATVYLGWHFFVDAIAGFALGAVTVWAAAMATGNRVGLRPQLQRAKPAPDTQPRLDAAPDVVTQEGQAPA